METIKYIDIITEEINEKKFDVFFDEIVLNNILAVLLENTSVIEFFEIIKNKEINNFIYSKNDFFIEVNFNKEYYNKWKLKRNLNDF